MTRRTQSLTLFAAPLLLAGCMVGPKYIVPKTGMAPSFKEAGPVPYKETAADGTTWQTATPEDAIPRGSWWTLFNDAELNTLEPKVEQANQTLKQADANLRAARAEINVRKADRFPTVGVNPVFGAQRYSGNPYFNPSPGFTPTQTVQYPFEVNYEVDLWGQVRHNIAAGKEEFQATAAERANVLLSLQAELAFDYFNLRTDDTLHQLLNDTVTQYKEAVRITTNRYNGGLAIKSDVTQAETQLQTAIVAASDVTIERAQYEHAIANLIGVAPASLTIPFSPLPEDTTPPVVPPGLPSELLERRPDVAAAERRANDANEAIGIAQAAFYPSINLSGALGFQSNAAVQSIFSPASVVYSLGPGLAYTFFDGGRRRGIKEESLALFDRNSATYKQTVLDAVQQVEDNLVSLRVLQQEAAQQRAGTTAAQESERIFNNRYVGGVDTYLQVVTAQTAALNSEVNDINILRRRMDDTVLLVKVLGGGWDRSQLPTP
ncbi:MAG TPA: efflux transporter outer membrane subunit [Acidobacteriaceae bacterium]|nr:efflux transporter outer membrane subunit [Acidobacteriaceae bacterium]